MFEHRRAPLVTRTAFYKRVARHAAIGAMLIAASLFIGMAGYREFEQMPWLDAFLNAAMILSGMGPATEIKSAGGKVFAGFYALFSGLAFVTVVGVIFAPVYHRFIHKFHLEFEKEKRAYEQSE